MSDGFTPSEILPLLGNVRPQGDWLMTYCPSHLDGEKHKAGQNAGRKDDGRSLGYSKTRNVLKCFNGCSTADVMKALRARAGQHREDPPERIQKPATPRNEHEVDRYLYRTTDGKASGTKRRIQWDDPTKRKGYDKRFTWSMPDGYDMKDMALWGLETLVDIDPEEWVEFVEGETCWRAFQSRQRPVVCHGGGGGTREFGQSLEALRGRKVRIWPDNDKTGFEYASRVKVALGSLAKAIRVMPAYGEEHGDVADYFEDGGQLEILLQERRTETLVEFRDDDAYRMFVPISGRPGQHVAFDIEDVEEVRRDLLATVRVHIPPFEDEAFELHVNLLSASAIGQLTTALNRVFKEHEIVWQSVLAKMVSELRRARRGGEIVTLEEASDSPAPAVEWLVPNLIPVGGTILFGAPGQGKSQLSLILAAAMRSALTVGPISVPIPIRVCYVNLERDAESMRRRLRFINEALGCDPRSPLYFVHARGRSLHSIKRQLRDDVKAKGINVLIIDSLSRTGYGNLNDNEAMNAIMNDLNAFTRQGTSWIAIAHESKAAEDNGREASAFGSMMQVAAADCAIRLTSEAVDQDQMLVKLIVTKANDFRKPGPVNFMLKFSQTGLTGVFSVVREASVEEQEAASLRVSIERTMRARGEMTTYELAEALAKPRASISAALNDMVREKHAEKGTGRPVYYHLITRSLASDPRSQGIQSVAMSSPPLKGGTSDQMPDHYDSTLKTGGEDHFVCAVCSSTKPDGNLSSRTADGAPVCSTCDSQEVSA